MLRKIATLLALSVYCCLYLLANGGKLENRNTRANEGRQACLGGRKVFYTCIDSNAVVVGQVCRCPVSRFSAALDDCRRKWGSTLHVERTHDQCHTGRYHQ